MKKGLLIFAIFGIMTSVLSAQEVTKTLSITPGGLYKALTLPEKKETTHLILTGSINAEDFKTIRDALPVLTFLDLSRVRIVEYKGKKGTVANAKNAKYAENTIPQFAFYNENNLTGKQTLTQIIFPKNLDGIGEKAFWSCYGLTETTIPETVTFIEDAAYYNCKSLTSITVMNSKPISKLGKGVFEALDPSTCVLHVPVGAQEAYVNAKQWGNFINISDDVETKTNEE